MKLLLYRSDKFENMCIDCCKQFGSAVLVRTNRPEFVSDRLNVGWPYTKDNPRVGTRSPPLAFYDDWHLCHSWNIINDISITTLPEFWQTFDRPCMLAWIEKRLMQDDNKNFPELRAKRMSKNGLECTFCLKPGTYLAPEDEAEGKSIDYQDYMTRELVRQVGSLVDELAICLDGQPAVIG